MRLGLRSGLRLGLRSELRSGLRLGFGLGLGLGLSSEFGVGFRVQVWVSSLGLGFEFRAAFFSLRGWV